MDKNEFIEKFASSDAMQKRDQKAQEMSRGLVKFDYKRDIPTIDFCEVCLHPKGRTFNLFEMCTSFDGVTIPELIKDFKDRSNAYFKDQKEFGENSQQILNLVIPPEPKMIMELGENLDALMEMGIMITVYASQSDKRGSCPLNDEFFMSLREDDAYTGMDNAGVFTNFLMNFVEML